MFLEIFLGIFILLFIVDYYKRMRIVKKLGNIPLVSQIPFVGSLIALLQLDPDNYARKWHEFIVRFGKTFSSIFLGSVFVVTADHRIAEVLLGSPHNLRKNFVYKMLKVWLGDGLLLSNGKTWQTMRKIITPTFHFKILEEFVEVFDRQTDVLIQKLASLANGQNTVNIYEPIGLLTMDIISETAMGVKINAQMDSKSEFVQAVNDITEIMANRFVRPHLSFKIFAKNMHKTQAKGIRVMHEFTEKIIAERKQTLLLTSKIETVGQHTITDSDDIGMKKRMAFLDVLLQSTVDGQPLLDKQIRDEVNTFMFEGHDTTTSAISFCLYALSRHRDIQDKLFEEIRGTFGDNLSSPVTYADLQQMDYLNCVIKESLRLYPPIPAIGRWLEQEMKFDDGILSPGTNVIILLWEMFRDPSIFDDPLTFKPERHVLNENAKLSSFSNIPFSAGPRNCIGQRFALFEIRTVITKILRNFELLPLGQEIQISMKIVLRSKNGVNIGLKPRHYN